MALTVSYPGVYAEEGASLALSIYSSPTAVPAIVVEDNDNLVDAAGECLRINSWFDYIEKLNLRFGPGYSLSFDATVNGRRDTNVRAYFENGGGYCYLVTPDHANQTIPRCSDITVIAPAQNNSHGWVSMGTLCQPGTGRFGIIDGPQTEITSSFVPNWASNPCTAVYYPYLKASWSPNEISPGVVAAGIYCAVDRNRGVWKAPANVYLPANYQPLFKVTDDLQGQFNQGLAINMIRKFDGQGAILWGARTLEDSDKWRYIPVRRLFDSVERDIKEALQKMVFESNNQPTWEKVRSAINNYLYGLWRAGALMGATEKDAFFVQIGEGITMNSDDIAQGKMIVKVGMAATRPAEFIILRFTQNVG